MDYIGRDTLGHHGPRGSLFSLERRWGILRAAMRGPLAISLPRLRAHLETLARFGRNPDGKGITRSCWSPAHEEARAWLLDRMKEAGLSTWVDEAGNTFGRLGNGGPVVMTGSHIDTVPSGGPARRGPAGFGGLRWPHTQPPERART